MDVRQCTCLADVTPFPLLTSAPAVTPKTEPESCVRFLAKKSCNFVFFKETYKHEFSTDLAVQLEGLAAKKTSSR